MRFALLALLLFPACLQDETAARYGAAGHLWVLDELDSTPFAGRATLSFPERGRVEGRGPCNNFTADMTAPYPWFEVDGLASGTSICADIASEQRFLAALSAMSQIEVSGGTLLLSNEAGREMLFKSGG